MLDIKLTTNATATATAATITTTTTTTTTSITSTTTTIMYMIKDAGTCTLTQHLLVYRLKLQRHPVC